MYRTHINYNGVSVYVTITVYSWLPSKLHHYIVIWVVATIIIKCRKWLYHIFQYSINANFLHENFAQLRYSNKAVNFVKTKIFFA